MKRNSFFLAGVALLALGTTACQNKNVDTPVVPQATSGSTYASMLISTGRSIESRAYQQEDNAGLATEQKLTTLDFLSTRGNNTFMEGTQDTDGKFWMVQHSTGTMYKTAPWKVDAGSIYFAVIANKATDLGTVTIGDASTLIYGSSTKPGTDIQKVTKDDNFVMTSKVATGKTITDGKTKDQVKRGTGETDNVFSVDLERIMCQGKVAVNDDLKAKLEKAGETDEKLMGKHFTDTEEKDGKVQLDDMKYAAVNGAVKTYVFADNAGMRMFQPSDHNYGANFKSAIHDKQKDNFNDAKEASSVKEDLIRLGNFATEQGGYAAKEVLTDKADAKTKAGIYFFENSVDNTKLDANNKKYGYYRLAYAKVYATFFPNQIYKLNESKELVLDTEYTLGATFYVGEDSRLFYSTKEAAQADKLNTSKKYYTYTNGKCAYRALWNRDVDKDGKTVKNADTRRNNIYLLTISGFKSVGMPWDPSDPQDPNLPKGEDENEGGDDTVPGGDSSIEKTETYMRVDATILPWNLVTREVTFGNE